MTNYPEDYDLDTSRGHIVEDGSTIALFLLFFAAMFVATGIAKLFGVL